MKGEFIAVWPDFADQVLVRLSIDWSPPIEWASDLCLETANATAGGSEVHTGLMSAIERPDDAMELLSALDPSCFTSEAAACERIPAFRDVCAEYDDELAEEFLALTKEFATRFSLRYVVADDCRLLISPTGLVASLVETVSRLGETSPTMKARLKDVCESIADVEREPQNERRIREAIRNQFILAEELAKSCAETTKHTLGDMCREINDWPHPTYGKALSTLYGFRNDFPAMGHSGNPSAANRQLDARDVTSMAAILFGFAPYLVDELDSHVGWQAPSEVAL